jgi:hypothetical protein
VTGELIAENRVFHEPSVGAITCLATLKQAAAGRVPLLPLHPVPGFVEGLYLARVRVPWVNGTVTARVYSKTGAWRYLPFSSSVTISVRQPE